MMKQRVGNVLRLTGVAAIVGVLLTAPITLAARESGQDRWRTLIPASSQIFAIIETVKGDQMTLRTLNTVSTPDDRIFLSFNSLVSAIAFPIRPGATRREICVTRVQPFDPFRENQTQAVITMTEAALSKRYGVHCLGTLADARGAVGLLMEIVKPETVVTISLNGDWKLDAQDTGGQP